MFTYWRRLRASALGLKGDVAQPDILVSQHGRDLRGDVALRRDRGTPPLVGDDQLFTCLQLAGQCRIAVGALVVEPAQCHI